MMGGAAGRDARFLPRLCNDSLHNREFDLQPEEIASSQQISS